MLQIYQNNLYSAALLLILLIATISIHKRLSVPQCLLWSYCALSSLYPSFSVFYNPQEYLNPIFLSATKVAAAQSLVLVLLIPIVTLYANKELLNKTLKAFFIIEAVIILFYRETVMLGWSSFSSTMLALSIFLFFPVKRLRDLFIITMIVIASFINISVTAMLIYFFALSVILWKEYKIYVLGMIGSGIGLFLYISPPELTNGNGRYLMWSDYGSVWLSSLPKIFGTGLGTWEWIGPQIRGSRDFIGYSMIHNDYFQLLIETGFIGLFLFLWVLGEAYFKKRKDMKFLISIGSAAIACFTYFPLHIIPGQVLVLYYFLYGHYESLEKNQTIRRD